MCGIAGFVAFDGHARETARARLRRMTDSIVHRGPDEEGFFVDDHVALGHRRLSIIDLSSGQQPMSAEDGRYTIVFNGEVYNFQDVRLELEGHGHRFRTRSDTEVILIAYAQWGEDCVRRLAGMFAFAIWDARDQRLFLARDRVGKKPLYYCRNGSTFAFASELKALRVVGDCADALDSEALDCYFTFGYIPAPRTIYRGVTKLQSARHLTITAMSLREQVYWRLGFGTPVQRPFEAAVEEFESLLDAAVECRLMSEVPLGAFLSGGLDSSLVVAAMARRLGKPVITNSIGFSDGEDELPLARMVARRFGTDHREHMVVPDVADVLGRIAWHFDEPLADSSALPTWYVCEMARRSVTVALSGDGGDEAFGGYTFRYQPHAWESRVRAMLPAALRGCVFGSLGAIWPDSRRLPRPLRLKTFLGNLAVGDMEAFTRDLAWLRPQDRRRLYTAGFRDALRGFDPGETVAMHYLHNDAPDALSRAQYTDVNVYMTDDVLVKVDRMSMAHSLEIRSPLLDHRILEFAATLPFEHKLDGTRGKRLLRAAAARRLPAELLSAPKRGFSIPVTEWLRGSLREMAESAIFDAHSPAIDMLEGAQLRRMWNDHQSGSRDNSVLLWGIMMLGMWDRARQSAVAHV